MTTMSRPTMAIALHRPWLRRLADDLVSWLRRLRTPAPLGPADYAGLARIRVAEAVDGERVLPGHAYIAPGGLHLSVERSGANYIARVRDGEPVNRHKPSVEVLFQSAARVVGPNALGVMLTGMGGDGAKAMREMRDAGSWNVCQDEASCVVFGMPREAIAHGAAHEVMPLGKIAGALIDRLRSTSGLSTTRV